MNLELKIDKLEQEINAIKARNKKVEGDKAWETSNFRIILITCVIYVIASLLLFFIGIPNFLFNALIPPLGFFLSMQSFPFIKRWWLRNH